MLFAITCQDKPGHLPLRLETRPTHLEYLKANVAKMVTVGPVLDDAGQPCGSLFVVDVADQQAAEDLVGNDPYSQAGLFESVTVRAFRLVFKDGAMV